jgi:hypothetical protein
VRVHVCVCDALRDRQANLHALAPRVCTFSAERPDKSFDLLHAVQHRRAGSLVLGALQVLPSRGEDACAQSR